MNFGFFVSSPITSLEPIQGVRGQFTIWYVWHHKFTLTTKEHGLLWNPASSRRIVSAWQSNFIGSIRHNSLKYTTLTVHKTAAVVRPVFADTLSIPHRVDVYSVLQSQHLVSNELNSRVSCDLVPRQLKPYDLSTDRKLQTSDEIFITTVNPGMLPLPDKWTLDMQFILQQVATLKGALTTMMIPSTPTHVRSLNSGSH